MVLAGLVAVLIYQVYKVKFAPVETTEDKINIVPPSGTVTDPPDDELPPEPPSDPNRPDTRRLVQKNPFSAIGLGGSLSEDTDQKPDLTLLKIMAYSGGKFVAQIRTQTARPKLYGIGAEFESYRIVSIDPNAQKVVIYSEEHRAEFTFTPEDK